MIILTIITPQMRTELTCLKQDNDKLQCQVTNKSLGSSESSLNTSNNDTDPDKRMSVNTSYSDTNSAVTSGGQPSSLDMSATTDPSNTDSKSVAINVSLSEGMTLLNLRRCCFNICYQIRLKCNSSSRDRILINLFNVQHINSERVSKFASTSRNLI